MIASMMQQCGNNRSGMKRLARALLVCFAAAFLGNTAKAQPHRDIHLYVESGALKTGAFDFDAGGVFIPDLRAYAGFFGEVANGTNDPGFTASIGTFPQGTLISFNILDALRRWDGTDFDAIPAERLFISLGATNRQTPLTADTFVAGFNIQAVPANGSVHQHINFFLTAPFSNGIFLLKIEIKAGNIPSPSLPIYLVFRQGADTMAHAAAFAYVENVLLAPPVCSGDANSDNAVNFADITAVLASFGSTGVPGIPGDSNRSGTVDFSDITFVLSNWGNVCP